MKVLPPSIDRFGVGFHPTGYETKSIGKDLSFVERYGKTLFVMPSGTEHKVAIVDFTDSKFETTYVTISDKEFVNGAPYGRYRRIEWDDRYRLCLD